MNSGGVSNSGIFSEIKKFLEDVKFLKSKVLNYQCLEYYVKNF